MAKFATGFRLQTNTKSALCDKKILLIAPLLDDALLRCAGQKLKAFFPAQIDALSFASIE